MAASPNNKEPAANLSDVRRKLIWRMGIAGVMVVGLLGGLAFFDYLSSRVESEPESVRYAEPVPVPRKTITQPVTPAEPPPAPKEEKTEAPPAPEVTTPPVDRAAPRPEAEPKAAAAPRSEPARRSGLTRSPQPPARAAAPTAAPASGARTTESPVAAARSEGAAAPAPQPPLMRLFSGYALQAGVFSDPRRAEELQARLALEGIPATIEARVQVGPFKSKDEAEAVREKMKAIGIDSVMLSPNRTRR